MRDAGEEVEGGGVEVCSVESVKGVRVVEGREVAVCSDKRKGIGGASEDMRGGSEACSVKGGDVRSPGEGAKI